MAVGRAKCSLCGDPYVKYEEDGDEFCSDECEEEHASKLEENEEYRRLRQEEKEEDEHIRNVTSNVSTRRSDAERDACWEIENVSAPPNRDCVVCGLRFYDRSNCRKYCSTTCRLERRGKHSKFVIFVRDDFRCIYCGRSSIEYEVELQVDHINPKASGVVDDTVANLVTACSTCNYQKAGRILPQDILTRVLEEVCRRNNLCGLNPSSYLRCL